MSIIDRYHTIPISILKEIITKIGMFVGILLWGWILWIDFPDKISYMSILYGMAVQFWVCCVGGVLLGLSGKRCVLCTKAHCTYDTKLKHERKK